MEFKLFQTLEIIKLLITTKLCEIHNRLVRTDAPEDLNMAKPTIRNLQASVTMPDPTSAPQSTSHFPTSQKQLKSTRWFKKNQRDLTEGGDESKKLIGEGKVIINETNVELHKIENSTYQREITGELDQVERSERRIGLPALKIALSSPTSILRPFFEDSIQGAKHWLGLKSRFN